MAAPSNSSFPTFEEAFREFEKLFVSPSLDEILWNPKIFSSGMNGRTISKIKKYILSRRGDSMRVLHTRKKLYSWILRALKVHPSDVPVFDFRVVSGFVTMAETSTFAASSHSVKVELAEEFPFGVDDVCYTHPQFRDPIYNIDEVMKYLREMWKRSSNPRRLADYSFKIDIFEGLRYLIRDTVDEMCDALVIDVERESPYSVLKEEILNFIVYTMWTNENKHLLDPREFDIDCYTIVYENLLYRIFSRIFPPTSGTATSEVGGGGGNPLDDVAFPVKMTRIFFKGIQVDITSSGDSSFVTYRQIVEKMLMLFNSRASTGQSSSTGRGSPISRECSPKITVRFLIREGEPEVWLDADAESVPHFGTCSLEEDGSFYSSEEV